ncbi:MAG: hypothetical protein EBZ50_01420, partial [Alphaproteobacteria bacterium]|nr:hypothetical protein [Alphaproteobacteria bacterium]
GAYVHATFLVAGPWILTALTIAGISAFAPAPQGVIQDFRTLLIYNFLFSILLASPIALPATRFASDEIYARRFESMQSALVVALLLFALVGFGTIAPLYALGLSGPLALAAFQNFMLLGATWLVIPFLGTLRHYLSVSLAFIAAMAVTLTLLALQRAPDVAALLNTFSVGLAVALALLSARLAAAHGGAFRFEMRLLKPYLQFWELTAIGLVYSLSIWIDKIVMWIGAPGGIDRLSSGGFPTMPDYDSALFWAARSPGRRPRCRRAWRHLRSVFAMLAAGSVIAATAVLFSYAAIENLALLGSQAGMLRAGLIGVAFQTSAMLCMCLLLYFDLRRYALAITVASFLLNGGLTLAFLPLGPAYFGYGFMIAAMLTFLLALALLAKELPWLHFHAFVTTNASAKPSAKRIAKRLADARN